MIRRQLLLVLVALALGLFYEAFVWGKPTNSAFLIFIFLCLELGPLALQVYNGSRPAGHSYWLLPLPVFFAFTASLTAQHPESLKYKLSLVFTFLFLMLLSMTYLSGQLERYSLSDYLRYFFRLAISIIVRPIQFIWQMWRDIAFSQGHFGPDIVSDKYARRIAFWVFAALVALFCWADWVYQQFHYTLIKSIIEVFSQGEVNVLRMVIWSWIILGFLLYAAEKSWAMGTAGNTRPWFNYEFSPLVYVASFTPLFTLTVLRISCAYRAKICINNEGFPAMLESNKGFWILTLACVLVFAVVIWLNYVAVLDKEIYRRYRAVVNYILFFYVAIVLLLAGISVKEDTVGIGDIRHVIYARCSLIWLGAMFLLFIICEHRRRERNFPYAALWMSTGFVVMFIIASLIMPAL